MPDTWPFADPENVATLTLTRIVRGESPILRVSHDLDDGGWQFLDGSPVSSEDACVVCLRAMIDRDPSLRELADLPLGWVAERSAPGAAWSRTPAVSEADVEQKLRTDVDEFGWHVIKIPEDDEGPAFAYSIGLFRSYGHAELIIFGLDPDLMHQIINGIGESIREGRRFTAGESAAGFLEGFDVRFLDVARRHYREYFGYARWYYESDDFAVLQCLWPDMKGRFPTDMDFPELLRRRQPLLDA